MFAVSVSDSLQQALDEFFAFLPRLLGFLIILAIGYLVARAVKAIITKALEKLGVDRALHSGSIGEYVNRAAPTLKPSSLIGTVAFWFLFLGALAIAVSQLGIAALDNFVAGIGAYLPNVVAAILIFVIASALSAAVGTLVVKVMGDTPTGKIVGSVVPVLIMAIATFMILNQLRIAPEIVTITYAALIGAAALALALAFGLGGRDVAARMLSEAYEAGRRTSGQVREDLETGRARAQQQAQQVQQQGGGASGDATAARPVTSGTANDPTRTDGIA
jgi:hypothetical protein